MSALLLAEAHQAADLGLLARRLAASDPDAVVRVVARGERVGCFAVTPFEVVVMRAARLRRALGDAEQLDVVVEAGTLAARAAAATEVLELPPPVPALRWTGPLPPLSGWARIGELPLEQARALVADGIEEFRARTAATPEGDRSRAVLESIAADVWEREVPPGVRVRLLHAASAYGFLGEQAPDAQQAPDTGQAPAPDPAEPAADAELRATGSGGGYTALPVATHGRWTRVDAPYGTVLAREGSALDLLIG